MNDRRDIACLCLCILFACVCAGYAADHPSVEELQVQVTKVLRTNQCDIRLVNAVRNLSRQDRLPLARELLAAKHPAMRCHALRMLKEYAPQAVSKSIRKLLRDPSPNIRNNAALYLATEARDAEARKMLLENAKSENADVSMSALRLLGKLRDPRANRLLKELIADNKTPRKARLAAIAAAGEAKAEECVSALIKALDDKRPRGLHPKDTARVCDIAAAAVEQVLDMHYMPVGAYLAAPAERRDEAIARWESWFARQGEHPDLHPRTTFVDHLLTEQLAVLANQPKDEERKAAQARLRTALKTDFCLGDLAGVDAVVAPSVRDQWRIMKVSGEKWWYKYTGYWHELDLAYERYFLRGKGPLPMKSHQQAAAFIAFADGSSRLPKIWVWSLCRNFREAFPNSALAGKVDGIKKGLESQFRKRKKQVVLHGHTAVLEPIPPPHRPPKPGTMAPAGYSALHDRLCQRPSNWALYCSAIDYFRRRDAARKARGEPENPRWPTTRVAFKQKFKLYPGNEWPFLANAAYQLRVVGNRRRAIEFADKALILNPDNAKCYAIRGMIGVVLKTSLPVALEDLTQAYRLTPESLGDEPETPEAIVFLVEKALESGNKGRARAYLKALGGLRAFNSERAFRESAAYVTLLRRANAP